MNTTSLSDRVLGAVFSLTISAAFFAYAIIPASPMPLA